ncbi:aldo/keto reductase [Roseibium sp.]|uniref:aldo/keto reductase n=1 Tax=Roseibium sp. TaxID=1936156 RepID=UPI00326454C8
MRFSSRLGLGTVQFGMKYGLKKQQATPDQVRDIFRLVREDRSIRWIDTAAAYGESESLLGRMDLDGLQVFTKVQSLASAEDPVAAVERSVRNSLDQLRRTRIDGLLIHNVDDLLGPHGADIWAALQEYKKEGLVGHLGISAYDADKIQKAVELHQGIEFVQAPLNVVDQRLLTGGTLRFLADSGIAFVARSVFLQGLLLTSPKNLPDRWANLKPGLEELSRTARRLGLTKLQLCLGFVLQCQLVETCVVGANSIAQLREIIDTGTIRPVGDLGHLACDDPALVDPRYWN